MWSDAAAPSFCLLAEIPLTEAQIRVLIGVIIAGVIVGGLNSVKVTLDIVRFVRGEPPSDQRFASKADLAAAMAEIEAVEERTEKALVELKRVADRERSEFRATLKEIFDRMDAMNRSLGRIEGTLNKK